MVMTSDTLTDGFAGSRCLVTGGAGFIGSNLVRALLAAGAGVTVIDNFATGKREHLPAAEGLTVVEGDLGSLAELPEMVAAADFVFHLAAQVGNVKSIEETEQDARTNVLGSVRLLRACRGTAVRKLVYSSSSAIFGEAEKLPIDEDHPRAPASFYALSKLTAESYATLAASLWGVPAVSLRYFNVYGLPMENNEYTGVISIWYHRLLAGEPLVVYGDGGAVRDFVYVEDVVQANLAAALAGRPGRVYNVGSGRPTTIAELARTMIDLAGADVDVLFRDPRAGEVRDSLADVARAAAELGYAPAWDLRRGLAEMWRELAAEASR
jgi:UDP-glucose 4-epimerase